MFRIRSFAKLAFAGNKGLLEEFPEGMALPQADQERWKERQYYSASAARTGAAAATSKINNDL